MRLFHHVLAEYVCRSCEWKRTVVTPSIGPFFYLVVVGTGMAAWALVDWQDWRHHAADLLWTIPGEVVLLYLAGALSGVVDAATGRVPVGVCRRCGDLVGFMGRHFNPDGEARPRREDLEVLAIFGALNAMVFGVYWTGLSP